MPAWLTKSFEEHSILWFLISSVVGGVIGAATTFLFESFLPQWLQQRREVLATKRKYSTPILLAADELRKRLENIIKFIDLVETESWLKPVASYYFNSTLYTCAQFYGWHQMLRGQIVYLDFTSTGETKRYEKFLRAIRRGFSSPELLQSIRCSDPNDSSDKWVFSFWLQSIGDAMIKDKENSAQLLNFGDFIKEVLATTDPNLREALTALRAMFADLKKDDVRFRRIVAIHAILNAFVDDVDPKHIKTEKLDSHWELLSETEVASVKRLISQITAKPIEEIS